MPAKKPQQKRRRYHCLPRELPRRTVTVCDACYRASCWQGTRFCDEYRTAGAKEATRIELAILDLEHSDYWKKPAAL